MNWAHPRSRGENRAWRRGVRNGRGSSPLTRGKQVGSGDGVGGGGLIPAHAGKTFLIQDASAFLRAHPRSRGENHDHHDLDQARAGSSPLTRGKRMSRARCAPDTGLIPAHAGKTHLPLPVDPHSRAHPRSRGENRYQYQGVTDMQGSSPLTRGKPVRASGSRWPSGLIPAHAGKTHLPLPVDPHSRAHPRSRGENCLQGGARSGERGSSPLTRGKPHRGGLVS